MNYRTRFWLTVALLSVAAIVIGASLGLAARYAESVMEARAIKNLTGKDVSPWDLMWVRTRINADDIK